MMGVCFPSRTSLLAIAALSLTLAVGCGGESSRTAPAAENTLSLDVDERLADTTYTLLDQDSSVVPFPDAFLGKPVILGTIYTRCPNVCPKITANMKAIRGALDTSAVHVVSVTFDPYRDTPARLAAYRAQYGLAGTAWPFLTGDRPTIRRLMDRLGVRHTIEGTDREFPRPDTDSSYVYTHSNQITLIDAKGRVRATYGGSQTPPTLIANDLEKIQL
jgi:protein SCO1/2